MLTRTLCWARPLGQHCGPALFNIKVHGSWQIMLEDRTVLHTHSLQSFFALSSYWNSNKRSKNSWNKIFEKIKENRLELHYVNVRQFHVGIYWVNWSCVLKIYLTRGRLIDKRIIIYDKLSFLNKYFMPQPKFNILQWISTLTSSK